MKTEEEWNWNEHVLMFRTDRMWKKCTPRQTTWNTFEVIIWTWWKVVIDRRNHCCFFPVDIAGYEKWHLVVAIFCSQKNKPQLFCIECNANFVWVFLFEFCDWTKFFFFYFMLFSYDIEQQVSGGINYGTLILLHLVFCFLTEIQIQGNSSISVAFV